MLDIRNKNKLYTNLKSVLKTDLIPTEIWQASGHNEFKPAAVLVPLFWKDEEIHILFTKRSEKLKKHPGQVSFPGGGFDQADGTIRQAAIRETQEEIGIDSSFIKIVGYLDDIKTHSGYYVTSFVGILQNGFTTNINEDEVAEIFAVPLAFFCKSSNRIKKSVTHKGKNIEYWVYQYQQQTIWGVTAEIIVKLINKLNTN